MLTSVVRRSKISSCKIITPSAATSVGYFSSTTSKIEVEQNYAQGEWKTYGDIESYKPKKFQIKTYNKISPVGLSRFSSSDYDVRSGEGGELQQGAMAHAILLRSYKLQEADVEPTVRAIARCVSKKAVERMTEMGIPVFNTPGANANAVKELILCGLLLGSRRIIDGINHMKTLGEQGIAKERVEKDKAMFGGREIAGKTLSVLGLGHIGAATARDAARIGMKIVGYDPALSVESALKLPRRPMTLSESITSAVSNADYISLNIPYIKGEKGTHGIISKDVISHFSPSAVLVNFARGELVDSAAMKEFLDANPDARYVTDFPDDLLWDHKNVVVLPHLGASTEEAEDSAASMAADTIREFLETGTIRNSVNFPNTTLGERAPNTVRFTVVNQNKPGMLAPILETFSKHDLNIMEQINQSRGNIAYNIVDVDLSSQDEKDVISFKNIQKELTMLDGVLSSRIIYGVAGTAYAKNIDGNYYY